MDSRVDGIFNEIEKGRQECKPKLFGVLFGTIGDRGHKIQDVFRCDGGKVNVTEMVLEVAKDELIVPQRIFF